MIAALILALSLQILDDSAAAKLADAAAQGLSLAEYERKQSAVTDTSSVHTEEPTETRRCAIMRSVSAQLESIESRWTALNGADTISPTLEQIAKALNDRSTGPIGVAAAEGIEQARSGHDKAKLEIMGLLAELHEVRWQMIAAELSAC